MIVFFATACFAFSFQAIRLRNFGLTQERSSCHVYPASYRASVVSLKIARESSVAVDPNDLAKLIDAGMMESDALKVRI